MSSSVLVNNSPLENPFVVGVVVAPRRFKIIVCFEIPSIRSKV